MMFAISSLRASDRFIVRRAGSAALQKCRKLPQTSARPESKNPGLASSDCLVCCFGAKVQLHFGAGKNHLAAVAFDLAG